MTIRSKTKYQKPKRRLFGIWFLIFGLAGCAKYYYNPAPQILPQYIKKMAIRPFANRTQQFGNRRKIDPGRSIPD